jgi:hypothetical protein
MVLQAESTENQPDIENNNLPDYCLDIGINYKFDTGNILKRRYIYSANILEKHLWIQLKLYYWQQFLSHWASAYTGSTHRRTREKLMILSRRSQDHFFSLMPRMTIMNHIPGNSFIPFISFYFLLPDNGRD